MWKLCEKRDDPYGRDTMSTENISHGPHRRNCVWWKVIRLLQRAVNY